MPNTEEKNIKELFRKTAYWENYYAGSDVGLFIGDRWVDDVITLQYTLNNNKTPVHGYMSESFDAIARGTYVIQGQLAVAFTEPGYLHKILTGSHSRFDPNEIVREKLTGKRRDIERPVQEPVTSKTPVSGKLRDRRVDRYGYEDKFFKNTVGKGFDIYVTFGDITETYRSGAVILIENCHITSSSMVLEPSGEPIAEIYSFFAKELFDATPKFQAAYKVDLESEKQREQEKWDAIKRAQE